MAKTVENISHKPKHRNNCFLGCFGSSHRRASEKKLLPEIVDQSGSHRKKTRWLSKWSFHLKKSSSKTAPVNANLTTGKRIIFNTEIHNSLKLLSSKSLTPVTDHIEPAEIQVVESDPNFPQKANERYKNPTDTVLGNRAESKKSDTRQNGVFSSRKKGGGKAKTVDDVPITPVKKTSSATMTRCKSQPEIIQSTDFPPLKLSEPAVTIGKNIINRKYSKPVAENIDTVVGTSTIMVALVIMILWGKIYAILCMSAWFFLIPRIRKAMKSDVISKKRLNSDLDSEEHKKKVVFEGFLTRNQQKIVGFV